MSINALKQGFEALLRVHGEAVTCDGFQCRALVNRTPTGRELGSTIQVSSLKQSTIQFLTGVPVEENDVILDTLGVKHTVFEIRPLGHCIQVNCTQA